MDEKFIALTFDDGPNNVTTPKVLDVLEKHNVVGSFFLVGDNINEESAKQSKRAVQMGCEICNHSRTHSAMPDLSGETMAAEIAYTSEKCREISGYEPRFFRPPYIAVNDEMYKNIRLPFICGYGCNDWELEVSAEYRYKTTLENAKNGAIILLHDMENNDNTVEALDMIIPALKAEGYTFVTVTDLFDRCGVVPQTDKMYSCVFD